MTPQNIVFKEGTFGKAYTKVLATLLTRGTVSSPRGMKTKEILAAQVVITDLRQNIIASELRDLNFRFMVAEWLWIMAGKNDVKSIMKYNKQIEKFSDNGEIFNGAYGPRLLPQWKHVYKALQKEDSRQAVATIWTPNPEDSKDIPCTIALQFLIRDKKLHMVVTMRSSDAWLGLPYDVFNFSMMANGIAGMLGIETGAITMQLGSLHLYENNWIAATEVAEVGCKTIVSPQLPGIPDALDLLESSASKSPGSAEVPIWDYYRAVLHNCQTKIEAMGVLVSASQY